MSTRAAEKSPGSVPPKAIQAKITEAYAKQSREAIEERWILENLPLVRHIACKVAANMLSGVDMEDLISAGTVGLVRAARAYDPGRDAEFKTYAYIRIRGAIIDELRGKSFLPSSVHARVKHVQQTYRKLVSENGEPPGDVELAKAAGMSQQQLYRTLQEARKRRFLSIHGLSEDQPTRSAIVPVDKSPSPEDQSERNELLARLTDAVRELPKRDRLLLLLYYERDLNMKEIAQTLNLTESRISQLHASALFKLSMKLR